MASVRFRCFAHGFQLLAGPTLNSVSWFKNRNSISCDSRSKSHETTPHVFYIFYIFLHSTLDIAVQKSASVPNYHQIHFRIDLWHCKRRSLVDVGWQRWNFHHWVLLTGVHYPGCAEQPVTWYRLVTSSCTLRKCCGHQPSAGALSQALSCVHAVSYLDSCMLCIQMWIHYIQTWSSAVP